MISQQELESAIRRWKARQAGQDFQDAEPTGQGATVVAVAAYASVEPEYDVDEGMAYETQSVDGGVPEYVPSMSDSSLIELDPDAGDPDDRL
ncbi:MAG: hypothetical protein SF187_14645 [Deltaproteobacteria bacterium]|nr:hypothetical protein [Deltaproteobacteria bacterium]